MRLRALALEGGLAALAPCPHNAACPLLSGQGGRTWCHFTFDSRDAPDWLLRLSTEAGLPKSGLSLAPLLLGPDAENAPVAGQGTGLPARVLSAPFPVPGLAGRGRYACTAQGLALLEDAEARRATPKAGRALSAGRARSRPQSLERRGLGIFS